MVKQISRLHLPFSLCGLTSQVVAEVTEVKGQRSFQDEWAGAASTGGWAAEEPDSSKRTLMTTINMMYDIDILVNYVMGIISSLK